ncbi:MAG TPA: PDZ domain-containing protein, partial [Pyrinomonadaceae bacterium]
RTATASAQPTATLNNGLWGALDQDKGRTSLAAQPAKVPFIKACGRGKFPPWMLWPMIGVLAVTIIEGVRPFRAKNTWPTRRIFAPPVPRRPAAPNLSEESYLGAGGFEETSDGLALDVVTPPGSPADRAGLVGGDIIISFDGQPVREARAFKRLLEQTPAGKTVDVIFMRDGATKIAKLTTISEDEQERLKELFDERPEGKGYIGEGTDLERVQLPGSNIYGVSLNAIRTNRPAEVSGLRNGDIVIEFDGVPTRTRKELESRIQRALPGSTATATVMRGNERLEIPVRIGRED